MSLTVSRYSIKAKEEENTLFLGDLKINQLWEYVKTKKGNLISEKQNRVSSTNDDKVNDSDDAQKYTELKLEISSTYFQEKTSMNFFIIKIYLNFNKKSIKMRLILTIIIIFLFTHLKPYGRTSISAVSSSTFSVL